MRWQFFKRARRDEDFANEVASHLALEADRLVQLGLPPEEAMRAARRAFGNTATAREQFHEAHRALWLEHLTQDVRYALRAMRRRPGFTAIAILTIALSIGLNTTIFSIFDAVALRPLSLGGSNPVLSLYQEFHRARGGGRKVSGGASLFSLPEYLEYRDQNSVFSGLAAYVPEFTAALDTDARPVRGQLTSCNYFEVLEAAPVIGRGFAPSECVGDDAGPVAVISHDLWQTKYAADPAILGKTVRLNRIPLTIIGVAAPGFQGTEIVVPTFWAPLTMQWALSGRAAQASQLHEENLSWLAVIGRLKERLTLSGARANLRVIAARLDQKYSGRTTRLLVEKARLLAQPEARGIVFAVGGVFLAAVGLVLLVACANLANLFLVRAASRQREIAVRLATGASRWRIVRQLLTESLLIALLGGCLGTVLAQGSASAIAALITSDPGSTPLRIPVGIDLRVFGYALLLTVGTGLAFGLAPALQATRPDLIRALKQEDYDPEGGRTWLRRSLVGIQVAVCLVLLMAAGLLLRGLKRAQTVDPGFVMNGVTTLSFDLQREGYTAAQASAFELALATSLRGLPGVDEVALAATVPLGSAHTSSPFRAPENPQLSVELNVVSAGFFRSVRIPLVRGRDFNSAETAAGGHVVIVNESAARKFWPGQDALGKLLHDSQDRGYTVVGVARDAEVSALGQEHVPFLFFAATPSEGLEIKTAIVRSTGSDPSSAIRAAALSLDPDLHINTGSLRDVLGPYLQVSALTAALSAILGALALLLASIGIYGTVAYAVWRRTREIGIRAALGADSGKVIGLIVYQAMRPVAIGAVIGTGLCLGAS